MSNDDDVLEHNSQEEPGSVDIVDLLEIANSKVFDDEEGLFNRNKELVKHFNELETNFKPDYYYFHNTWFKAAGIVTYLLKADRFVILKLVESSVLPT